MSTPTSEPRRTGFFHIVGRLWHYGRRYRGLFVVCAAASVVLNFANLVRPWLVKILTDRILTGSSLEGHVGLLIGLLAALLGATVVKGIFTYVQGLTLNMASQGTVRDLREEAYDHLLRLPVPWFDGRKSGDLIIRFTDDMRMITEFLTSGLMVVGNDVIVLVTSLVFMVTKDWQLTILAMIVTPAAGMIVRRYSKRLTRATDEAQEQLSDLTSHLHETVSGIKQVKAFNREGDESERFKGKNEQAFRHAMRLVQLTATQSPIMEILATGGIAVVMWYCALKVITGELTLGDLLAFWAYMLLATTPINRLPQTVGVISRGCSATARVLEVRDTPAETDCETSPVELQGGIHLSDVQFRYSDRPTGGDIASPGAITPPTREERGALRGLTLDIAPGEHVAIVGRNGAGKSTFANLLPRFYGAQSGAVELDGHPLAELPLRSLRGQIGIVAQDTFLFSGTIRENIAYGKEGATMDEIVRAATEACAHDLIVGLDGAYDHVLNERGANLSGGQRQRIALARMLLGNPKIVILDEATASLDARAEEDLQRSLHVATRGRTVLNIAHRPTITRGADRVIVLDEGRVAESGTHDELLAKRGVFWDLFSQAPGNGKAPP